MSNLALRLYNTGIVNTASGAVTVAGSLLLYSAVASSFRVLTSQVFAFLTWLGYIVLLLMPLGVAISVFGIRQAFAAKRMIAGDGSSQSILDVLARVLAIRNYSLILLTAALVYGSFYAAVSSTIVYQPADDFSKLYGAVIPSIVVIVCCGGPGYIPIVTVYLTEHLGLLIIPANILLLILVSGLVGLNTALALYEFHNRPKGAGGRWLGGFGATTGLFTACPTCAGLFLGGLVQGVGTTAAATVLASYQPLFVAATLPLLIASVLLIARRLRKRSGNSN